MVEDSAGRIGSYRADSIVCGHVLDVLRQIPAGVFQCCVISPPYWGLRDYGISPIVWDGDTDCEHEWGAEGTIHTGGHQKDEHGGQRVGRDFSAQNAVRDRSTGQFCHLCGAWRGSLGLEPTPDLYVQHLVHIFREVRRVLRDDGTVWLNLGDSYYGGKGRSGYELPYEAEERRARGETLQRAYNVPGYMDIRPSDRKHDVLKPKDLAGIPWRVAFALQADGWWLRSDIIWAKPNPMPESVTDRPTKAHEYLFLLSKSGSTQYWTHRDRAGTRIKPKPDYRWVHAATGEETAEEPPDWKMSRIPCPDCQGTGWTETTAMTSLFGEIVVSGTIRCERCEQSEDHTVPEWGRINLWRGHDYFYDQDAIRVPHKWEHVGEYRLGEGSKNQGSVEKPVQGRGNTTGSFRAFAQGGRNKRTVWTIPTQRFAEAHFAVFPEALVEPCILAGTSARGCCPECGAPWERVVKREFVAQQDVAPDRGIRGAPGQKPMDWSNTWGGWPRGTTASRTIGWHPTCSCATTVSETLPGADLAPVPCVVVDPCMGAGTVALVAKRLRRAYFGIDLNPDYVEMACKRVAHVQVRLL